MIKFEYRPWAPDSDVDALFDPPAVEIVTMTLGDDLSWDEAVCEFQNFLRAAGYVIPYDFEDDSNTGVAFEDESNTDVAEVERLRAKKKQIYEDLKNQVEAYAKGEVTYDPETGEPLVDGYPLYSGLPNRKREADLKIGAWLSAALEDPSTCQSMKDDINEWFECTPQVHRNTMQT